VGVRHTETSLIIWSGLPNTLVSAGQSQTTKASSEVDQAFSASRFYNAGDKGCAFGPMDEIAEIMLKMDPGQTLEIYAADPTVAADLSAWCRMTGHKLVEQQGFHYLIKHKE
jgi:TusA-related sulfurtransferase